VGVYLDKLRASLRGLLFRSYLEYWGLVLQLKLLRRQ
jgi:hypothetical protein